MQQQSVGWASRSCTAARVLGTAVLVGGLGVVGSIWPTGLWAADVPLREFAQRPDRFVDQTITIQGRLKFVGKNYFSDPVAHFVLEDAEGNQVAVTPWLPLEVVPLAPGEPGVAERPRIMSDYLDKPMRVRGKVRFERHTNRHEVTPETAETLPSE